MSELVVMRALNLVFSVLAAYFSVRLVFAFPKFSIVGISLALWSAHRAIFYLSRLAFDVDPLIINQWSNIISLQGEIAVITSAYTLLRQYGHS